MHRIVLVLALLSLLVLPTTPAGAGAAVIERPTFSCAAGGATMRFDWRPASDASMQYIDVSLADNGFAAGTFISAGPFDGSVESYTWTGMRANVRHYYRVNTLTPDGWQSASDTFSAPCRPSEASLGSRDAPYSLYRGVYSLDLRTSAIKRIADLRGQYDFYPNDRTIDWSSDGSRIAVATGSATGSLKVYDTNGTLKSESKENAFDVTWLAGDTLGVHLQRNLPTGEEGQAIVNASTGAIESVLPYLAGGTWSPDGRRIAFFYLERGDDRRSLFVRDIASGADVFLGRDLFSQAYWSRDGKRLAVGRYGPGAATIVLDATTGAELARFDRGGQDVAWSPDGRSLAMSGSTGGGADTLEVVVLEADGSSSRRVARGYRPAWSPDGASLTYIRDGALWLTMLSDGIETPLLRPQLPVIQEQRWSPAGNMIAFRVAGSGGIYVARTDGSEESYLAPGFNARWSPKGDRIGFVYGEGALGFGGAVYTMTPRGTAINRIGSVYSSDAVLGCSSGARYDWSPAGSMISYWTQDFDSTSGFRGRSAYVVQDAQIAAPARLSSGTGPVWAPSGDRLAYSQPSALVPGAFAACEVVTSRLDGTEAKVVAANAQAPRWSPDGAWLAVEASTFYSPQGRMRVVAADGSGQRGGDFAGFGAVWSPDGKQIAYTRSSVITGNLAPAPPHTPMQLVVSKPDGSEVRVLAQGEIGRLDWSPDGTRIVYSKTEQDKANLNVVDLATGQSTAIGAGRWPSWSPDGLWIAFER